MKKYTFRLTLLASILLMTAFCHAGCTQSRQEDPSDSHVNMTDTSPQESVTETQYEILPQEIFDDMTLTFVSAEEKETWREPLERLLDNARKFAGEDYEIKTHEDLPIIVKGYDCGLLDVNFDGTPEVIINCGGGTAGNAYYEIYDLYTGKVMGNFDGGMDESWQIFYSTESATFCYLGEYRWREGADTDHSFLSTIGYNTERQEYETRELLCKTQVTFIRTDDPPVWYYYQSGNKLSGQDYYQAYNDYRRQYLLVEGTGFTLISWGDLEAEGDTQEMLSEKMADALLSTDQKFLLPDADS